MSDSPDFAKLPAGTTRRDHWDAVYLEKPDEGLSWRQSEPALSLALALEFARPTDPVIDIGAGESALAGRLVATGFESVAALDISAAAIERAKRRAGDAAAAIRWMVADALNAPQLPRARLWHDRAVFHFLTEGEDRRRYADLAARTVEPGGHAIVAAFAPEGPDRCSNLPVRRYSGEALAAEFAPAFELVRSVPETHTTPWGKAQPFTYAVLRRVTA